MALQRVTIGFDGGGQVLAVRMEDDALDELLPAVNGADWTTSRSTTARSA